MPYKDAETRRAAYARQRERFAAEKRALRARNGEQINQRTREWRDANRERYRANGRAFYARHAERLRAERQARYDANPEKHREIARQAHARRMRRDPEQYRAWVRARWAREKDAAGSCTAEEWGVVLDTYGRACLCCGAEDDLTQDHVIPLVLGGTHWPWNLQPLCRRCNSAKSARSTADYRPDGGEAIRIILEAV
jgi:5-methylcytosine-specific restriction endonuclease McrA